MHVTEIVGTLLRTYLLSHFQLLIVNLVAVLQAAASMVVNVGSFSDPKGLEGLAHFLGVRSVVYFL